jgi:hypothetical protein
MTSANTNTIIGTQAGDTLTTGSNNIIIGFNADASAANATNEITLGNTSINYLQLGDYLHINRVGNDAVFYNNKDVGSKMLFRNDTNDVDILSIDGGNENVTIKELNVTGLASLDGGIDVDGAFTVADTSGNITTSGTLDVNNNVSFTSADANKPLFVIKNTADDADSSILRFTKNRNDGSTNNNDTCGIIDVFGEDSAGNEKYLSEIRTTILNSTAGSVRSKVEISVAEASGGLVEGLTIEGQATNGRVDVNINAHDGGNTGLKLGGTLVTATANELNILDGVTSTANELNLVDGSGAGTIINSKAVIYGAAGQVNATTLQVSGTDLELNHLSNVKFNDTNFSNSLILGHTTTGVLNNAQYNFGVLSGTLESITEGDYNIGLGRDTLKSLTSGSYNIAIGSFALQSITTSITGTIAIGYEALKNATSGGSLAIGRQALIAHTSGTYNLSIGDYSTIATTTGSYNVAMGRFSMRRNLTGSNNVAIGFEALSGTTNGTDRIDFNTAVGYQAGYTLYNAANQLASSRNVFMGYQSGYTLTTGKNNTLLGTNAGYSGTNNLTTAENVTLIGYNAQASASNATNEITLGDTNVTTLRCGTSTIASTSDARDKKEIVDSEYGIEFINTLKPREFTWAKRDGGESMNGKRRLGFIAQELLEAMPNNENEVLDLVYTSNPEHLEAKYGNLVPILVKSVQDLSSENAALANECAGLANECAGLKDRLDKLEEIVSKLI